MKSFIDKKIESNLKPFYTLKPITTTTTPKTELALNAKLSPSFHCWAQSAALTIVWARKMILFNKIKLLPIIIQYL